MQIKIPNGNIWTKKLGKKSGKMKYFAKLANIALNVFLRQESRKKYNSVHIM